MMEDKRNIENDVQEIMGLVDDIISCDSPTYQFGCKREIRSKLHKLVTQCSVQEQLLSIQPVVVDDYGVLRFKKNTVVGNLYEHGVKTGYGLNEMYTENHTDEDRMQFAQLIGYSVRGYSTLSYVTDKSVNAVFAIANTTKE